MKNVLPVAALACLSVLIIGAGHANAGQPGKGVRVLLRNEMAGRAAPRVGAADTLELHYRYYYSDSDSILSKNNHVGFGVADTLSPATNSMGAFIEIEPIAVFNLRIQYDYLQYFGLFTAMLTFPRADSDYSDSVLDDREDNNEAEWAVGRRFTVAPTFQAMYKRFAMLNTLSFQWYDIAKDGYFYNPSEDILMHNKEYFFTNSALVGYIAWKRNDSEMIILGTRHVYSWVHRTHRQRQELDGAMVWMMGDKIWFMEKPMIVAAAGGFLKDRYRERDIFVGGMFTFEYTLWRSGGD